MKILQCLICCFFLSALQDGNTGLGLVEAETNVYIRSVGDDLSAECSSSASGNMKFLCKETCENENVLMETRDDNAQRGRYSMKYKDGGFLQSPVLTVSITQLMKSDSGRYRCGLGRTLSTASFKQFEVVVADAVLTKLRSLDQKPINKRSGTDLTVAFFFTVPGNTFFFCKEKCEDKNVLVDTDGNSVTKDRYSIEYRDDAFTEGTVFVSITQLKESDSGRYRCGLDRRFFPDSYYDFVVSVTDAPSPTQSLRISSGSFTQTTDQQPNKTNSSGTTLMLSVGLTLVFMVVLLTAAVLIFCRNRTSKPKGPPGETDYTSVSEMNRVYEHIREDDTHSRAPVKTSTVYSSTKFTNLRGVESSDDYSVVTAAGSQHKADDDPGKLTYSEVSFSNRSIGPGHNAPRSRETHVIYSVPRVEVSSDRIRDDPPLYSTVTLHQQMEKKFWRTCKCSCRPCGCKSKYVWKDKCCSTLVCVVIHPVIRAFLISLLWVVSVLIDGDWYVCCRNYHSEHPQLACKNQDNITAEEKAFSAEMKNFSKTLGFGTLLVIIVVGLLMSIFDCNTNREILYHTQVLELEENVVKKILREAAKEKLNEAVIQKIDETRWTEYFNIAEDVIKSKQPPLSVEQMRQLKEFRERTNTTTGETTGETTEPQINRTMYSPNSSEHNTSEETELTVLMKS